MFGLAYYSKATKPFTEIELQELAENANTKNAHLSITGFLQFKKGYFLQYLEGEEASVKELMGAITLDERHKVLKLIYLPELECRHFERWFMRYWTYNEFSEINLISLLEHVLRDMKLEIYGEDALRQRIVDLVKRMSKFQHLYVNGS